MTRTTNKVVLIGRLASNAGSEESGIILFIDTGDGANGGLLRVKVSGILSRNAIMFSRGDILYVEGRLKTVKLSGNIPEGLRGASDVEAVYVKKINPRSVPETKGAD